MARYPGAVWNGPTPNEVVGGMKSYRLFVVHIQEGNEAGTRSWVHNPASQVSAHFGNPKTGQPEQWVDTHDEAWAEASYNPVGISVENEGYTGQSLTASQLENIAQILAWCHTTHGIPLQITTDPNGSGVIGHGQLGVAGGDHLDCPGQPIVKQFPQIVAQAIKIVQGVDMPLSDDDINKVASATSSLIRNTQLGEIDLAGAQTGTTRSLGNVVAQRRANDQAILDAVAKVPGSQIDYAQLGAAVAKNIDYTQLSAALAAHFKIS